MTVDVEVARYAVRTFRFIPSERRLVSLSSAMVVGKSWDEGVCEAKCARRLRRKRSEVTGEWIIDYEGHEAPQLSCTCGIYGSLSLETLQNQYPWQTRQLTAVIAAEGTTIIGPRGLRTQFARVVAYWVSSSQQCRHLIPVCERQFPDATRFLRRPKMLAAYNIPAKQQVADDDIPRYEPYWA